MERKDLKKLTKGQLIKLISKKVSNHEDLLDNDPFKDEVAQEPTKPRTGKWESIKSKPVPRKSVNEDIILPPKVSKWLTLNTDKANSCIRNKIK